MVKRANRPHRKQTKSQTKRKKRQRHTQFKEIKVQFGHEAIAKAWNPRKTVKQNYSELGLSFDANDRKSVVRQASTVADIDVDESLDTIHERLAQHRDSDEDCDAPSEDEAPVVTAHAAALNEEFESFKALEGVRVPRALPQMSINEQRRLALMLAKYGDNYKAMTRDIKLNVNQETEPKLRKRFELFHAIQAHGAEH